MTAAQTRIDTLLARNPLGQGIELRKGLRKIHVLPLTAYYEVDTSRSAVAVSAVAYTPFLGDTPRARTGRKTGRSLARSSFTSQQPDVLFEVDL